MKKISAALILGLTTSLANAAYGIIDIEKVIDQSTYLKQQNLALQQKVKPQSTQLEGIAQQLEGMQKRAQQGANLSEAERKKLSTDYQAKAQEANKIQQAVQATVQTSIQQMNKTMDARIKQVAEQLRQENKLDVVLNKNSTLAYDAQYDLTDKMIQKVNAIK
jgi:outer membrane protein